MQPGRASPEEATSLVTGTVEMAAASMEQTTVLAATEITEERQVRVHSSLCVKCSQRVKVISE